MSMRDTMRFVRAFTRDRRGIGAIAPSGRVLAQAMVKSLGDIEPGKVICELGPGTGIFTRALAARHPRCTVVAVEADAELARSLRCALPAVRVIHGCASRIRDHLHRLNLDPSRVAGVLSGLPLLSLPGSLPQDILREVMLTLPEGCPFVQFTYSQMAWRKFHPEGLIFERSKRVFSNVPPASVLRFLRSDDGPTGIPKKRRRQAA